MGRTKSPPIRLVISGYDAEADRIARGSLPTKARCAKNFERAYAWFGAEIKYTLRFDSGQPIEAEKAEREATENLARYELERWRIRRKLIKIP